jgi:nucleoside-diphosphate-sugar epimerase
MDMRHLDRYLAQTNRLRTEGTDHLLEAGRAVGARRFVAQSYTGWPFARTGGPVKNETDPLDPDPPKALRSALEAIRYLEQAVTGLTALEGIVLRYGAFYGPGTDISLDNEATMAKLIRKRQFPLVGSGGGLWSFIHIEDAATATVAAIERGSRGVYQIVDNEPAAVREWLPALAKALGAAPPRRVPTWIARSVAGEAAVVMMTDSRGASNAKAKHELGWVPRYASWRQGFDKGMG